MFNVQAGDTTAPCAVPPSLRRVTRTRVVRVVYTPPHVGAAPCLVWVACMVSVDRASPIRIDDPRIDAGERSRRVCGVGRVLSLYPVGGLRWFRSRFQRSLQSKIFSLSFFFFFI